MYSTLRGVEVSWVRWLLALIVLVTGWYFFFGQSKSLGATLTVSRGDFSEQVRVSGTVIPTHDATLGFATNGRISGVYASVGQHVSAGTILAETENGDLIGTLAQAQANLASIKAGTRPEEVAVAETSVISARTALVQAIQSAYTTADDAIHNKVDAFFSNPRTIPKLSFTVANMTLQAIVERDRSLVEPMLSSWALLVEKLTPENVVESARASQAYLAQVTTVLADANTALNQSTPDQTTTATNIASYTSTLAVARTSVNAVATSLTQASSALDTAQKNLILKQSGPTSEILAAQEAAVRSAQAMLGKTRVVAPFSGIITRMDAKVGEIVSPTGSGIAIQTDGLFEIETYVPEVTISRISVGNPATTTLDAYGSSVVFPAVVIAVDPAETLRDGVPAYKTTLAFLNADSRIRSGMTTDVIMQTGLLRDAVVIPSGAIGSKNGARYVSIVNGTTVTSRTVTLGPSPALGQAHILSGLTSGDTILLTPVP